MCLRNVEQYKERNRRLEEQVKNHDEETEGIKKELKQKEDEAKSKDKEVETAKRVSQCLHAFLQRTLSLVEIARTLYMLHGNMQTNTSQNIKVSGSIHGNIL